MPHFAKIAAGLMLLLLAACASKFESDVARFHRLPPPQGETFHVVAADPKKQDSLEFATYAQYVSAEMLKHGYRQADANTPAQLEVRIDYGVSPGTEKIASRPGYGSGFYGSRFAWPYGFYPYWGGFYDPFWGYNDTEVYSYTVYTRSLGMEIVRPGTSKEHGDVVMFEGRVQSVGKDNRLPEVMPYLVQAMFTDFPGTSGTTKNVKIELPGGSDSGSKY